MNRWANSWLSGSRFAGVHLLAQIGEQFVFAQHLHARAANSKASRSVGGLHCVVFEREPPAQHVQRRRRLAACHFDQIQIARHVERAVFQAHADQLHAIVGLDQHPRHAGARIDAVDRDRLPAHLLRAVS